MAKKYLRTCEVCLRRFRARADARTCSPACRKNLQRAARRVISETETIAENVTQEAVAIGEKIEVAVEKAETALLSQLDDEAGFIEVHQPGQLIRPGSVIPSLAKASSQPVSPAVAEPVDTSTVLTESENLDPEDELEFTDSSKTSKGVLKLMSGVLAVLLILAGLLALLDFSGLLPSNYSQKITVNKLGNTIQNVTNQVSSLNKQVVTLRGAAGANGANGSNGSKGTAGAQGATGPQGPAGADGATGATGPEGPQGPAGTGGSGCTNGNCVSLQSASPGVQESGNISITGNMNVGGLYLVNGNQIAVSNLADSGNIARLNGTGPQTFTGNNKFTGTVLSKNVFNTTSAFQVQNAAGNGILTADTVNDRVAINQNTANYSLDVNGDINTTSEYRVNGLQISTANLSDGASVARLNVNQTFTGINTFSSGSNSFTGNGSGLTQLNASNLTTGTVPSARLPNTLVQTNANNVFTGYNTFEPSINSTTAFQIQNTAGTSNLFIADTANNRIGINNASPSFALDVTGTINGTTLLQNGNNVCDVSGNCAGVGGQIGGSGTPGTVAMFTTGSATIGDSIITQNSGTIGIAGNINLTGVNPKYEINGSQISSGNLSDSSNIARLNANQTFTGNNSFTGIVTVGNSSATGFKLQNGAGNQVLTGDTLNSQILFGQAGALNGQIVFNDSANTNTVTIASGVTAASYNLLLPTNGPTVNNCLQTDSVNPNQLIFGTCAGPGSGVNTVSTIDSQPKSANGAVIVGQDIFMQTADGSNPGLVSTTAQTFAGDKTLTGNTTLTGTVLAKNTTDSGSAFAIQDSAGSAVLTADTANRFIGIGTGGPQAALDVKASSPEFFDGFETGVLNPFTSSTGWAVANNNAHSGSYSVVTSNNSGSTLSLSQTLNSPGTVSFWMKWNLSALCSTITFKVDGTTVYTRSGLSNCTTSYALFSFAVGAGTHSFTWNFSGSWGGTVWVDDVTVTNAGAGTAAIFNGGNVGIGTSFPTASLEVDGTQLIKPASIDTSTLFQVQNAEGGALFNADSLNSIVTVSQGNLIVSGLGTPVAPGVANSSNQGGTLSGNPATTYYYKVTAVNTGGGESLASPETSFSAAGFTPLTPPGAPSLTTAAGTDLGVGTYLYKVTFVTANGETTGGTTASVTTTSGNQDVNVNSIPVGPAGTTARKLYRTVVNGADGSQQLLTTIGDNSTTSFLDNIPDGSLGTGLPGSNTATTNNNETSISITTIPGAASYRIYRGTSPGAENSYQTTTVTPFIDTGAAGTASGTPTSSNAEHIGIGTSAPTANLTVAGTALFQNSIDTAGAFSIQNAAGNTLLGVDTAGGQVLLGKASALTGKLTFNNSANSNTATIQAGATTSSYTLTLPTALPVSNQCLQTNNTGVITFTSCIGSGSATLTNIYGNGTTQADETITLDTTRQGIVIQDAASPTGSNLFTVQSNGGSTKYLNVTSTGITVAGTVDASGGYKVAGTAGSGITCSGGQVLQNAVINGGITTGGTCATNGVGATLQSAYDASTSPATITTSSSTKNVILKAGSGNDSTGIFQIQSSAGLPVLNADSVNRFVGINQTIPNATLDVQASSSSFIDGFETGALSPFTTSGGWSVGTGNAHNGSYSAGVVGGGTFTLTLVKTLSSSGTVSFWAKASTGCGTAVLQIDGVTQITVSNCNTVPYAFYSTSVPSGTHTLQWVLSGGGFNNYYVDDVTVTNAGVGTTALFNGGNVGIGTAFPNATLDVAGTSHLQASSDNTAEFQIQSANAADTLFTVDTTNNKLVVGNSTGTNTATTLLVLDSATADPATGFNGAMYYNTTNNVNRCYVNGAWANCGANGTTLQNAYDNSSSPTTITTSSAAKGIIFKAGASNDTNSLFKIQDSSSNTILDVDSTNRYVGINQSTPNASLDVLASSSNFFDGFETGTISPFATSSVAGGAPLWTIPNGGAHTGSFYAYSGDLRSGGPETNQMTLTKTLNSAGTISFWYQTVAQEFFGGVTFKIDGVTAYSCSNVPSGCTSGWTFFSNPLSAGTHTFTWTATNGTSGLDDWFKVDDITITNAGVGTAALFNGGNVGIGTSFPNTTLDITGTSHLQASSDNTAEFQIQSANAADTLFTVDSTNNKIVIGNATGTNTATTLLILDSATADPATGFNGAMYYNTTSNIYRCYANGAWANCSTAGGAVTLQQAYNNSGTPATITTTSSTKGVVLAAGAGDDSTSLFQVQSAAGTSLLNVDSTNYQITASQTNLFLTDNSTPTGLGVAAGSNQGGTLSGSGSTTYYYKVTALKASGESLASSEQSINGASFTPLTAPTAATVGTPSAGGSVTIGTHSYKVTYVTANGETTGGTTSSQVNVTTGGTQTVPLTNIPLGPTGTTSRKVYRTVAGDTGSYLLVTTIANNTATTFNDTIADGSLGVAAPVSNTATTNTNNATISWTAVNGATSYKIYRGTSAGAENAYQTSATSPFTDTGAAGTAATIPSYTGWNSLGVGTTTPVATLDIAGNSHFKDLIDNTSSFQVQNAAGGNILNADTTNSVITVGQGDLVVTGLGTPLAPVLSAGSNQGGTFSGAAGTTYFYKVTAINTAGNETLASPEASFSSSNFTPLTTPTALTAAASATAGNVSCNNTAGQGCKYEVTFVAANGETTGGTASASVLNVASKQITLTNIPTGPSGTTARKIYRSTNNSAYLLDQTINDNITTSGTDNVASPAGAIPGINTATTNTNNITVTFTPIPGAASYRIYRGTATGAENAYQTTAISPFTDTGTAGTAATTPTVSNVGRVGIGTSAPTANLDVRGTINVVGSAQLQSNINSLNAFNFQDASGISALNIDTVDRFIGINNANPNATLDVQASSSSFTDGFETGVISPFTGTWTASQNFPHSGIFSAYTANTGRSMTLIRTLNSPGNLSFWLEYQAGNCGGSITFTIDGVTQFSASNGSCGFLVPYALHSFALSAGTHTFQWTTGGASVNHAVVDDVTITNSGAGTAALFNGGNVGIGTAFPNATLDVAGTSHFQATSGNDSTSLFQIQSSGGANLFTADSVNTNISTAANIIASGSSTATTATTSGTATNTTTVNLVSAAFANNDVIFIDNAGQDFYTRVVSGGGTTTLTVSPAVSYDNAAPVTKYTVQNIGATASDYTTQANRFFQGYFLGGVVTGAGSTIYSDGNIKSVTNMQITAPSMVLQATGTSGNAFQILNGSGKSLFSVDTNNNDIAVGTAGPSGQDGAIVFNNASNTNTVTLQTGATASTYSLLLPTTGPAINQCIVTDSTTANQLKFGSCSTGVTPTTTLQNAYDNSSSPATITTSAAAKNIIVKAGSGNDSTGIFQIQNSSGQSVLNADSVNRFVGINNATPNATLDVQASSSSFTDGFETGALSPFTSTSDWTPTNTNAHSGAWDAGATAGSGTLQLIRTLNAPGTISFWFRLHCSGGGNNIMFKIDGVQQVDVGCPGGDQTVGYTLYSYAVGSGTHTFTWVIGQLDNFGSTNGNAQVDDVTLTNSGAGTAALFNGGNVGIGTSFPNQTLDVLGTSHFQASSDSANLFQIQNTAASSMLNVDSTNMQVTVGQSNLLLTDLSAPTSLVVAGANTGGSLSGAAGTTYYYIVTALSGAGESLGSNEVSINGQSFTKLSAPAAPTGSAVAGAAGLGIGNYLYKLTVVTANGETTAGTESATITTTSGNQNVSLTLPAVPTGATGFKVYRTAVGGASGSELLLTAGGCSGTISTTSCTDSATDAQRSGSAPASNTATTNLNNASVSWTAVAGATGYRVYRGTSAGGENTYFAAASPPLTDTGAAGTAGTVHTFSSINDIGIGISTPSANLDVRGNVLFKNVQDTSTAFQIQNSAGTESLLSVDTTARSASGGNIVKIGNSTGTDTNTTLLVVDSATADPTSNLSVLNGGIYYNSTTGKLSYIEGNTVKQFSNSLQNAYDNSTSPATITTSSASKNVVIKAGASNDSTGLFQLQDSGGNSILNADSVNRFVGINKATPNATLDVQASSSSFIDGFESGALSPFVGTSWSVVTGTPHTGADSAYSSTSMTTLSLTKTLTAAGTISFWAKFHGANCGANIQFQIDGVTNVTWSGCTDIPYTFYSKPVSAGAHTFTWTPVSFTSSSFLYLDDLTLTNAGVGTTALFNGGNVGIGTAFPNQTLDVTGTVHFQASSDNSAEFSVQNVAGNNYLLVDTSGANLYVGNTGIASTVQIGNTTGAVTQTINIGNNATASSVTNTSIGSTIGASTTNITAGSGGINLNAGTTVASNVSFTANGSALFKDATNSTSAFRIQDSSGNSVLNADSVNRFVGVNNANPQATLDVQASSPGFFDGFESGTKPPFTGTSWSVAATHPHSGAYSLGTTTASVTASLTETLSAPGTISFWAEVETPNTFTSTFDIDGTTKQSWPGAPTHYNYAQYSFAVAAGTHTFHWNTPFCFVGGDCPFMYIDDVSVSNAGVGTTALFNGGNVGIGTTFPNATLDVTGTEHFQAASDSTALFQIQNAAGTNLLNIDSTANKITLNQSNVFVTDLSAPTSPSVAAGANTGGTLSGAATTTYFYKITALSGAGESLGSSEVSINGQSFTKLSAPAAPTVAIGAAGNVTGTYTYRVTFLTANGETTVGTTSAAVSPSAQQVNLTAIPTGPTGTTGRNVYRCDNTGANCLRMTAGTTLADNVTTTLTDNTASYTGNPAPPGSNTATTNTNNASVSWTAVTGATSYRIYRGTSASGENAYQTSASSPLTDTGAAGTAATVPTRSTVAQIGVGTTTPGANLDIEGTALFKNIQNSTTALQIQNAAGNNELAIDTSGNNVTFGKASTVTTNLIFNNASGSGSITLTTANPASSNFTLTLPAETGTICTTAASAACVTAYSSTVSLQTAYNNSSSPATITTSSAAKNVIIKAGASSDATNLFNIQDSGGNSILDADSTHRYVGINNANPNATLDVQASSSSFTDGFESGSLSPFTTSASSGSGWTTTNSGPRTGTWAALGNVTVSGATTTLSLTKTLNSAGTVSFYEMYGNPHTFASWDFMIDGVTQVSSNGAQGSYALQSFAVSSGTHTFTWDVNGGSGSNNTLEVDDVTITNAGVGTAALFNGGNVGIGTAFPNYTLDVAGTTHIQASSDSATEFQIQNAAGSNALSVDTTSLNGFLTNTNFENSSVATWTYSGAAGGSVAQDATQHYLGNDSLKVITGTTAAANDGVKSTLNSTLAASTTYTVSWYDKITSGSFSDVVARFSYDGTTGNASNCTGINTQTVSTAGWTRHACQFTTGSAGTAPTAANAIFIVQQGANGGVQRTFYIDAVQLEQAASATGYKETGLSFNGLINSAVVIQGVNNSTTAFAVQNASGNNLFSIDSVNNIITLGTPSANPVILVLGNKNTSGDPGCTNGAIYYNSNTNRFRACTNGAWATFGAFAPGYEISYDQITANASLTATTEATATTAITSSSFSFDGSTAVMVDVYVPNLNTAGTVGLGLWLDGTEQFGHTWPTSAGGDSGIIEFKVRVTPGSGSHTFTVRGWDSGGTGTLNAGTGTGGASTYPPAYIRISVAN